jgi:AcrR family transcriptional regulator
MTRSRLNEDHRYGLLIDVISETLENKGVRGLTISSVAQASGLSRQWVYHFFPDINAAYSALYTRATRVYFANATPSPCDPDEWAEWLINRMLPLLDMAASDAIACNFILNEPSTENPGVAVLRDRMIEQFTQAWAGPFIECEVSYAQLNAVMTTLLSVVFGLALSISRGATDRQCAEGTVVTIVGSFLTAVSRVIALAD